MATQILIGLKRLADAKTRLGPDVPALRRRELMLAMLAVVVAAARDSGIGAVALATSEPSAPGLAAELGVTLAGDAGLSWNEGLVHALRSIEPPPAGVLYLAADLPLLTADELVAFVRAAPPRGVAIARARDGGTNALLVAPADALVPHFGSHRSASVHERLARAAGLASVVVDLPGLALDVDTVADAEDAGLIAPPVSGRGPAPGRG